MSEKMCANCIHDDVDAEIEPCYSCKEMGGFGESMYTPNAEERKLVVEWNKFPVDGKLACRVVEQSHFGLDFTPEQDRMFLRKRDGITLFSGTNATSKPSCSGGYFNVRNQQRRDDDSSFLVDANLAKGCKYRIAEYNATNGEGYKAKAEREKREHKDATDRCIEALNKEMIARSDKRHIEAHERIGCCSGERSFLKPWNTVIGVDPSANGDKYVFMHNPDVIESHAQAIAAEKIAEIRREVKHHFFYFDRLEKRDLSEYGKGRRDARLEICEIIQRVENP